MHSSRVWEITVSNEQLTSSLVASVIQELGVVAEDIG